MKNIRSFKAEKYNTASYIEAEPGIYACDSGFITGLCFEQEPEYEEGTSAAEISQYPLEDILDRYLVYVSDFFEELNNSESRVCYLEFCSGDIDNIRQLRSVIGKHVYNKVNGGAVNLVVE